MLPPRTRPLRTIALVVVSVVAGAALTAFAREGSTYRKLDIFARVLSYVENNYVEQVKEEDLVYGAVRGMLGSCCDPHTVFMTPEQYKQMKEETQGEFGGLGIEVAMKEGQLVVVAPIDDTPAARAGIKPGDKLVKIDGTATKDMTLGEAIEKMRGAAGTRVTLTLMREGFAEPRDFVLIRDQIRVKSVEARLIDKSWGYSRIKSFQDRTDQYLKKALEDMTRDAGGALRGLVLDLRKNPGGLLDQAVKVSDLFLEKGVIVSTEGRGRRPEVENAVARGTEPNYPLIVLIDGGSASASEIVAGALQDHGRAVIMGTQSFGKGSVQTVIELEDGSGLKLTIARYYTPKHRSIQEKGITPDVVVRDTPPAPGEEESSPSERQLRGHLKNDAPEEGPPGEKIDDHQLRTAIDYLKTWQIFRAQAGSKQPSP